MPNPREEFGHQYAQHSSLGFWYNLIGRPIQIFPPSHTRVEWTVIDPKNRESYFFLGEQGEEWAFAVAAGIITQSD